MGLDLTSESQSVTLPARQSQWEISPADCMRIPRDRLVRSPRLPVAISVILVALCCQACESPKTQMYEIRQRAFTYDPGRVTQDYREEFQYIEERRQRYGHTLTAVEDRSVSADVVPRNLAGLAFSGGGIRSATFHLGVLEALEEMNKLDRMDYLSTVSGGSYLAGWMIGHLGGEADDEYGYAISTEHPERLLNPREDFVTHLRHHAGFLREHGFWEGPSLIWSYLWRLPFYYLWDVALHIKTYPGIGNHLHLYNPYRRRIEVTYLRGQQATTLARANRPNHAGPYLIVNGNLVNRGRPRGHPSKVDRPYRDNYNFEFTRDFSGSDGLGYVQTAGFGLPVVDVLDENKESAVIDPRWVVVEDQPEGSCFREAAARIREEYCVRLSDAMTASGAGLDLDSLFEEAYHDDIARLALRFFSVPFNINNEFQTWNYARRYNGPFETMWDYFLMMTIQRLWPDTKSRWIEVTDGSFFDNLGAYSLLRREVSHVIVGDATLDKTYQYDYLRSLKRKVRTYFGEGTRWCGEIPQQREVAWYRRFWVRRPEGPTTVIHYLKPYVYNAELFKKNPTLSPPGSPFVSTTPEYGRDLARDPLDHPPIRPAHLDSEHVRRLAPDEQTASRLAHSVKKVLAFAASPEANGFPQTGTMLQWYELEEFEAYRHLGYLMGWAYLKEVEFSGAEVTPSAECQPIPAT